MSKLDQRMKMKRLATRNALPRNDDPNVERLTAAAINRAGTVHSRGLKSHYELRAALNPDNLDHHVGEPGDIEGFTTSAGRFVTRRQAVHIGIASRQLSPGWGDVQRELLSSDINW